MEVRLKQGWMGHRPGAIIKVTEGCANTLFQKDAAEKLEPESKRDIKAKLQDILDRRALRIPQTDGRERRFRN
jgi:hypothetical protein